MGVLTISIALVSIVLSAFKSEESDDIDKPSNTIVIGEYDWNLGRRIRLLDLTDSYDRICYVFSQNGKPVNHVAFNSLPSDLKETVRKWGISFPTRVFRTKWKGETVYHLLSGAYDESFGVFHETGKNFELNKNYSKYLSFLEEQEGTECILILMGEVVKNPAGAQNHLVGMWRNDWQHLSHGLSEPMEDDVVLLYPDLPFSITEVCQFDADGKGKLITEKNYTDGRKEVAVDKFNYELTDYSFDSSSYNYGYKCCYEAGDTIEYYARSKNDFRSFQRQYNPVNYPWYSISTYPFDSSADSNAKYSVPQPSSSNPIVGKWKGISKDYLLAMGKTSQTWVFRPDQTGYLLLDGLFNYSFAYTVNYSGNEALLTIYKYDTNFTIDEGFSSGDLYALDYDPTILPKGMTMKAKLNGNQLELEGWEWMDANFKIHPITYKRQSR